MTAAHSDVIVAGAGVAGLSAALTLSSAGAKVTLLERRPYIGGRAYSYDHPALDETIDSQHVVLGCCTNILDLARQAGISDTIRWYDELTFLEPSGRRTLLNTSALPAPGHQSLSFLRAPMLDLRDKRERGLALRLASKRQGATRSWCWRYRDAGGRQRRIVLERAGGMVDRVGQALRDDDDFLLRRFEAGGPKREFRCGPVGGGVRVAGLLDFQPHARLARVDRHRRRRRAAARNRGHRTLRRIR